MKYNTYGSGEFLDGSKYYGFQRSFRDSIKDKHKKLREWISWNNHGAKIMTVGIFAFGTLGVAGALFLPLIYGIYGSKPESSPNHFDTIDQKTAILANDSRSTVSITSGDFDGDGDIDLAIIADSGWRREVSILENRIKQEKK